MEPREQRLIKFAESVLNTLEEQAGDHGSDTSMEIVQKAYDLQLAKDNEEGYFHKVDDLDLQLQERLQIPNFFRNQAVEDKFLDHVEPELGSYLSGNLRDTWHTGTAQQRDKVLKILARAFLDHMYAQYKLDKPQGKIWVLCDPHSEASAFVNVYTDQAVAEQQLADIQDDEDSAYAYLKEFTLGRAAAAPTGRSTDAQILEDQDEV